MTLKKNYERRESGELRRPKRPAKTRDEARIKHELRHGNIESVVGYDELDDNWDDYEADSD